MAISETTAKSILRKHKRIDSWFASRYGMNLYRGCLHNCAYCDGRDEKYGVQGNFGSDIEVKTNAPEVLARELDPARKRKPLQPGFIFLGGGVNDCYQPVEKEYQLTCKILSLLLQHTFPVHILTKSTLVLRDLDLLKQLDARSRVIISMSFSSVDDEISARFEPGVPPPSQRLAALAKIKASGLACGMYLMPVLPCLTDTPNQLDKAVKAAAAAGLDFVVCGGMTLKAGRQMAHFYRVLEEGYPGLAENYRHLYYGHPYGQAREEYYQSLATLFHAVLTHYRMPGRIPMHLYADLVPENDRVVIMLDHLDYYWKLEGKSSPFGYAAYAVSRLQEPVSGLRHRLQQIKGVGGRTEKLILEIIRTGRLGLLRQYYLE